MLRHYLHLPFDSMTGSASEKTKTTILGICPNGFVPGAYIAHKEGWGMVNAALVFFVSMLAGFALRAVSDANILYGLDSFFEIAGILVIIVFAFALIYLGFKALFNLRV